MTTILSRSILRNAEARRLEEIAAFAAAFETYLIEQGGLELEQRARLEERADFARRLAEYNAERSENDAEEQELSELRMGYANWRDFDYRD